MSSACVTLAVVAASVINIIACRVTRVVPETAVVAGHAARWQAAPTA